MNTEFNAEEILEIACQIERNGAAFYRKAAEIVQDDHSRATLLELANMEDGHENLFEAMKAQDSGLQELLADPDGVAYMYLRAIAQNHVFVSTRSPADKIPPDAALIDVLNVAMQAELASIAYFQALLDNVPEHFHREKLTEIIEEEKRHVVIINNKILPLKR